MNINQWFKKKFALFLLVLLIVNHIILSLYGILKEESIDINYTYIFLLVLNAFVLMIYFFLLVRSRV